MRFKAGCWLEVLSSNKSSWKRDVARPIPSSLILEREGGFSESAELHECQGETLVVRWNSILATTQMGEEAAMWPDLIFNTWVKSGRFDKQSCCCLVFWLSWLVLVRPSKFDADHLLLDGWLLLMNRSSYHYYRLCPGGENFFCL